MNTTPIKVTPLKAGAGGLVAGLSLAATLIAGFEGERTHAYVDPAGIVTICDGTLVYQDGTKVKIGDVRSHEQCLNLLSGDVKLRVSKMQPMLQVPVTPKTAASMVSFAYNVGLGPFKLVASDFNAGQPVAGCNRMRLYSRARINGKLVVLPGLVTRRTMEANLCLSGL
jgi:lysozyme